MKGKRPSQQNVVSKVKFWCLLGVVTSVVAQRCPGQVGGGWEETDSSNSSSQNSFQEITTNSRTSVGSKSAGTRSQSGASRESSGDLSERTEALQLGDCGQETSLINKLTEGSRVFLTREESQHFLKECFLLNCEVVVEILSIKLQDPSYTVKMRALCAVACLMTSDLLSLEQIFGATQRRLHQLSEGPPGPVANKATKILRQFEALVGGAIHSTRQEAVNSSHQTTNHLHTSEHPAGIVLPPSSPLDPEEAQRSSIVELIKEESVEYQVEMIRTADGKLSSGGPELAGDVSANQSRLSLFRGMELVTKGRILCESDTESDKRDSVDVTRSVHRSERQLNSQVTRVEPGEDARSNLSPATAQLSAFSFLNF